MKKFSNKTKAGLLVGVLVALAITMSVVVSAEGIDPPTGFVTPITFTV